MTRAAAPLIAVDRALHLIGMADESLVGRRLRIVGERISVVRHDKVALVVRNVDAASWTPQMLEMHRGDASWVEREARLHELILDRVTPHATVAPARPFTTFADLDSLLATAAAQQTRWRRTLSRLAGKSEWALHVYRGPHAVPPKQPYMLRTTLAHTTDADAERKVTRPIGDHVVSVWKACSSLATAARRLELLPDPQHVFSASFLVAKTRREALVEVLERLHPHGKELGLTYYFEGPRPAFSFV